jgi:hypothetical protein
MGTLLCSDRAAYVSRTPAGRACASARLAGSMLVDVVDVVGAQLRARGQQQPCAASLLLASKNSQRAAACTSREASRSTRRSSSCLGSLLLEGGNRPVSADKSRACVNRGCTPSEFRTVFLTYWTMASDIRKGSSGGYWEYSRGTSSSWLLTLQTACHKAQPTLL